MYSNITIYNNNNNNNDDDDDSNYDDNDYSNIDKIPIKKLSLLNFNEVILLL
jgi:hypothetical protein